MSVVLLVTNELVLAVPAGRYAKDALEAVGIWQELTNKMIFGENVRQILDYLRRGEVDAGFLLGQPGQQEILDIPPAIEYGKHQHRIVGDPVDQAPGSNYKFTILGNALVLQFRNHPAPLGRKVQGGGSAFDGFQNLAGIRRAVQGNVFDDAKQVIMGCRGPDHPVRALHFFASSPSRSEKTSSWLSALPLRMSASPWETSFRMPMALRMAS